MEHALWWFKQASLASSSTELRNCKCCYLLAGQFLREVTTGRGSDAKFENTKNSICFERVKTILAGEVLDSDHQRQQIICMVVRVAHI